MILVDVVARGDLSGEHRGPLIIEDDDSTTLVPRGFQVSMDGLGNLVMEHDRPHGN
jgi:N-methylhydantoinase A/oxoprolinase/acetone carboxylase beta subunit